MNAQNQEEDKAKIKLLLWMFEAGSVSWGQMKKISGSADREFVELIKVGLIKADGSYFGGHIHYFPTGKTKRYLMARGVKVYVSAPDGAPLKNELHDEVLRNLRLKFENMGYKAWQSERCLRQRGMVEVTPDGILELGRRKVAIELEFSSKTATQYRKRFQFYEDHPAIDRVLYFVALPNLRDTILALTRDHAKVFVVLLKNFMEHERNAYVEHSRCPRALHLWTYLDLIKRKRCIVLEDLSVA